MPIASITVEEANSLLEEYLEILKGETDFRILEDTAEKANNILYDAIRNCPAEANAVRIPASIDLKRSESGLPNAGSIFSGRYRLEQFFESMMGKESVPETAHFEFVKHLPYIFTTGTHGSGERNAASSSCPNISFDLGICVDDVPIYLTMCLADQGILMREEIYLFPDEIESVSLGNVSDKDFTPLCQTIDRKMQSYDSPSAALHYFRFKGFFHRDIKYDEIPKNIKKLIPEDSGYILIPDISTDLLRDGWAGSKTKSISGFVGYTENGDDITLYEFDSFDIPKKLREIYSGNSAAVLASVISMNREMPHSKIKIYEGNSAIKRLSEIGIKRDF